MRKLFGFQAIEQLPSFFQLVSFHLETKKEEKKLTKNRWILMKIEQKVQMLWNRDGQICIKRRREKEHYECDGNEN